MNSQKFEAFSYCVGAHTDLVQKVLQVRYQLTIKLAERISY